MISVNFCFLKKKVVNLYILATRKQILIVIIKIYRLKLVNKLFFSIDSCDYLVTKEKNNKTFIIIISYM